MKLTLRPHHAMCLLNFRGKGYSAEFVENMNSVVASLTDTVMVTLKKQADCVCCSCKNRVDVTAENPAGCIFSEKVARYDEAVLHILNLTDGCTLAWHEIKTLVLSLIHISEPTRRS